MSAERLFQILGLIDEDLIEEAAQPQRQKRPRRAWTAAACAAVLLLGGGLLGRQPGFMGSGAGAGADGAPADPGDFPSSEGSSFQSYAGPVLPLTLAEADTGLTAERNLTWDFTPGTFDDGSPRQWGARVTDAYTLANPTDQALTATALYPFPGSFRDLGTCLPTADVNGEAAEGSLLAGAYAGGFQGVWGPDGQGGHVLDGSTLNLSPPGSWTDYQVLLEDGSYLAQAMADVPAPEIPVTVYELTDFTAPHDLYDAATQAVEFTIDSEAAAVLTYGFNGGSWDRDTGWCQYSFFVPDGVRRDEGPKLLIVLGEDIGDYTLTGYADGGCDREIEGVSCTVTRRETSLDQVLRQLCRSYLETDDFLHSDAGTDSLAALPLPLFQRAVTQLLVQYGPLSKTAVDRYDDGRLDDILAETLSQDRVLYLAVPVTVPAGRQISLTFSLWKAPSFDFGGSGAENAKLQGYDLMTSLGSNLDFTSLTAALANTEHIQIVRQDLGLDAGMMEATLDTSHPQYYLEIREKS